MSIKKAFQEEYIHQVFPFSLETQFMDGGKFYETFYGSSGRIFMCKNVCLAAILFVYKMLRGIYFVQINIFSNCLFEIFF